MRPANAVMMSLALLLIGTTAAVTHSGSGVSPPSVAATSEHRVTAVQWPLVAALELEYAVVGPDARRAMAMLTLQTSRVAPVVRQPASVVLALDVSGSMLGDKLRDARRAAQALVDRLGDDDRVTIVSFAQEAVVHVEGALLGTHRETVRAALADVSVRGTTCISCGLRSSYDVLGRQRSGLRRVILLSDGQANQGVQGASALGDIARQARREGIVTTSIGLGAGYDAAVMQAVATAGAGTYYFAHNATAIGPILDAERRHLEAVVVRNLQVRFRGLNGATLQDRRWAGAEFSDSLAAYSMGSMAADTERRLLVELRIPPELASHILVAEIRFEDLHGVERRLELSIGIQRSLDEAKVSRSRSLAVVAQRATVTHLHTLDRALKAKEAGRDGEAVRLLEGVAAALDAVAQETGDDKVAQQAKGVRVLKSKVERFEAGSKEMEATKRIHGARAAEIEGGVPADRSFHSNGMYDEGETQ